MADQSDGNILLVEPASPDELADLIMECNRRAAAGGAVRIGIVESPYRPAHCLGLTVLPEPTPPADEPNILVTLRKLDRIHEISKSDFLAVVDPGVRFVDLAAAAAREGLYLPCEPVLPWSPTTILSVFSGLEENPHNCGPDISEPLSKSENSVNLLSFMAFSFRMVLFPRL